MKDTIHKYKGYEIIGTTYTKEGAEIFHTGFYRSNSIHRNYNIKKDGKFVINPYILIETLKYAKERIDGLIKN